MISDFFECNSKGKPLKVKVATPEERAWKEHDWDALNKIIKDLVASDNPGKKQDPLFLTLDNINKTKIEMDIDYEYEGYSKYMIDKAMSQHVDVVLDCQAMNMISEHITNQMHFDFYRLSVMAKTRRGAWAALTENLRDKIICRMIQRKWNVGLVTARIYLANLTLSNELDSFILRNMSWLEDQTFLESLGAPKKDLQAIVAEFKNTYTIKEK